MTSVKKIVAAPTRPQTPDEPVRGRSHMRTPSVADIGARRDAHERAQSVSAFRRILAHLPGVGAAPPSPPRGRPEKAIELPFFQRSNSNDSSGS